MYYTNNPKIPPMMSRIIHGCQDNGQGYNMDYPEVFDLVIDRLQRSEDQL